METETGILKRWDRVKKWGIIYSPGNRRYFLHASKIQSGTPKLGCIVQFDVGEPRTPTELPTALNAIIFGDSAALLGVRKTAVRKDAATPINNGGQR